MTLTAATAGTIVIAPMPFDSDGRVDQRSVDSMCDFYGAIGCIGITVLGIMGEAPKLDMQEAVDVAIQVIRRVSDLDIVVDVDGAVDIKQW